jgi:peptidoglycan/xylan/chitin deacetylase (PgdA/CDA1 family)
MAGCPIILWSIDPEDWGDKDTQREVEQIVQEARDGSIILLHDIYPTSVDAALQVIDQLHQQGFLFVTIDELFAARGVELQPGQVYRSAYP